MENQSLLLILFPLWKRLFTDTVSGYKKFITDTVSGYKKFITDTVWGLKLQIHLGH